MNSRISHLERFCRMDEDPCGRTVLLVAAHPDDETLGAGARLCHLQGVWICHVTNGVPEDQALFTAEAESPAAYAQKRAREVRHALSGAGIAESRIHCLGYKDQEVVHSLPAVIEDLKREITLVQPEILVTHPYEGGHPDHDATAFAVHMALRLGDLGCHPLLIEMTSYHRGPSGLVTGCFLPHPDDPAERIILLDEADLERKKLMLSAYESQRPLLETLGVARHERFRIAPVYDFTKPPHDGELFYESLSWPMTGQKFCQTVAALGHLF